MLTTLVVIILFFVAFLMVAYEWAMYLLAILFIATVAIWCVTLYEEHVKQDVKRYEQVYNLFVVLRAGTIVLAIVLGTIWLLTRPFA